MSEPDSAPPATQTTDSDLLSAADSQPVWLAVARRFGVDRAVGFAVLARFWQLFTGPVTQLLIMFCFTEIQQGYYYVFMNLLAMQIFVELGLHVVIINVASHEWSGLAFTGEQITGDVRKRSRLVSLGRTAVSWYVIAMILFIIVVSASGTWFFLDLETDDSDWLHFASWFAPWITLVILTGLQLALLPLTAILEGCGQLPAVNRVRFWQGVAGSAVVWTLMLSGFGLWALCGSAAVRLCGEIYLVAIRYRPFFAVFCHGAEHERIDWKQEILPLQWRMAVQGSLLWLSTHLAGLVIVKYHGAAAAGRFGMMWTILAAIQAASLSWVETRRPLFGRLIAVRNFVELDKLFFDFSRISMILISVGASLFTLGVWLVNQMPWWVFERIAARLPDPATTAVFGLAIIIMHLAQCTNIYVRAHKRDPYMIPALIANPVIAALVFWLGRRYGIPGVGWGYLAGVGLLQAPLWVFVWARTRQIWHSEEAGL